MVIIPNGLEIFRGQNTKDSHYDTCFPKLKGSLVNCKLGFLCVNMYVL